MTSTDELGQAWFEELVDGQYMVTARADGETASASVRIAGGDGEVTIRIGEGGRTGVNRRCYPPASVPETQQAVDGTPLPTYHLRIPPDVRRAVGEICVQTEAREGPRYTVVTTAIIEKSFLEELGLGWSDFIPGIPIPISVILNLLTPSRLATEQHFHEETDDGHPLHVTLIYTAR